MVAARTCLIILLPLFPHLIGRVPKCREKQKDATSRFARDRLGCSKPNVVAGTVRACSDPDAPRDLPLRILFGSGLKLKSAKTRFRPSGAIGPDRMRAAAHSAAPYEHVALRRTWL